MNIEINFLHYEGNAGECLLGKVHMQELEVTIENTSWSNNSMNIGEII